MSTVADEFAETLVKAVISGRTGEALDLARANLWR